MRSSRECHKNPTAGASGHGFCQAATSKVCATCGLHLPTICTSRWRLPAEMVLVPRARQRFSAVGGGGLRSSNNGRTDTLIDRTETDQNRTNQVALAYREHCLHNASQEIEVRTSRPLQNQFHVGRGQGATPKARSYHCVFIGSSGQPGSGSGHCRCSTGNGRAQHDAVTAETGQVDATLLR
jgi:hypothetical protein